MGILQTQLQGLGLLRPPSPAGSGNAGGGGGARGGGSVRGPRGAGLFSPSFPDSHPASRAASQNLDGSGDLVRLPLLNCRVFLRGCLHHTVGVSSPSSCRARGHWHLCCTVATVNSGRSIGHQQYPQP